MMQNHHNDSTHPVGESTLAAALDYAALGWAVFPVAARRKVPLAGSEGVSEATQHPETIRKWWRATPQANIGVACGPSGIVAVDIDAERRGFDAWRDLRAEFGIDDRTVTNLTPGGGQHLIFKAPQGVQVKGGAAKLGPGVDVRAGGLYFVAPPSLHPNGKAYQWEPGYSPFDMQPLPFPRPLLPRLEAHRETSPHTLSEAILQGERNEVLFRLGASMRAKGMSEAGILAALQAENARCKPPLSERELEGIATSAGRYEPSAPPGRGDGHLPAELRALHLVSLADVKPEAVSWLWHPYIPQGKLTLLEGDPGVGKSWVSLAIATAVSLGKGLPGVSPTQPQPVVIASAEDGLGDTIRPRLDGMGADVSRILAIDGALTLDAEGFSSLESYLLRERPVLFIVDPLVAYLGATLDLHRSNETRAVMAKLAAIAERYGCAILAVRHLNKTGERKAIYRGLGSIDLTASCRSVLLCGCDPDNEQSRGVVHIKSNLAPKGEAIGYELRNGSFGWTEQCDLTAARILAAEDSGEGKSARDEAADFLRDELRDGPVAAAQVWRDAKEAGLSKATLKRAKAQVGVIARRYNEAGGKRGVGKWTWELPDSLLGVQEVQGYQEGLIENVDTLEHARYKNDPLPKTDDTLEQPSTVPASGGWEADL